MKPYFETSLGNLYHGDCLDVMRELPANSIDTIITDPPYGLGFMGKEWDTFKPDIIDRKMKKDSRNKVGISSQRRSNSAGSYDFSRNAEFQMDISPFFVEMLRVVKPGGTLLCFGGTRTYHRLACAIEDAGWILKDCIMWLYGSGFPKATDISKQLDKKSRRDYVIEAKKLGVLPKDANRSFIDWTKEGHNPSDKYWEEFKKVISKENWEKIERKVLGKRKIIKGVAFTSEGKEELDITEPNSNEAKLWNGWKSHGLKPAYEPILVAMKPNEGSYAQNALKWGVSGLNIDGGRIPTDDILHTREGKPGADFNDDSYKWKGESNSQHTKGRFPANIILDEEAAKMLDEQSGESKSSGGRSGHTKAYQGGYKQEYYGGKKPGLGDTGGASRFFYIAKASKAERGKNNNHPTVKPLKLMEYLCILTKTPTGGVVLDPFLGSGTTARACVRTGRKFIGIEKELEYCKIASRRIEAEARQGKLFFA